MTTESRKSGDSNIPSIWATTKNRTPRMRLLIAGIALALTGAVVGGVAILNNSHGIQNRNSGLLSDVGLTPLSLSEAIQQSKAHGVELYWVGPLDTTRYATNVLKNQVNAFHYLAGDASDVSTTTSELTITTYAASAGESQAQSGPLHPQQDVTTTNVRGDTIIYNPSDKRNIIVKLVDGLEDTKTTSEKKDSRQEETVILTFAEDQTLTHLIAMTEKVVPLY